MNPLRRTFLKPRWLGGCRFDPEYEACPGTCANSALSPAELAQRIKDHLT
jgi:hypothetical protein